MRRGAKYRRISDDREGRELGVQRQDEDLDALASRHDITIVADYVDNDISASTKSKKDRPGYRRMIEDAKAGNFDVILAYTSGRITRRPREFEDLIDLAVEYGTEFEYVRSPSFDLRTAQGRRVARTLAAQDAGEAEEIAERVQREVKRRAQVGEFHGGPRGYGITADGQNLMLDEADRIRGWADHVLAGGKLRTLATQMNTDGVPTVTGAKWTAHVIRRILMHPRIAGIRIYEGAEYSTPHPKIVEPGVWRALVKLLGDEDRKVHDLGTARRHLGVHMYICDRCSRTVNTGYAHPSGDRLYRCRGCWRSWKADPIDDFVLEMAEAALADEDRIQRLLPKPTDGGVDLAALNTEATAITTGLEATASDLALARHGAVRAALQKAIAEAEERLAEIDRQVTAASRVDPAAGVLAAADPVKAFRALDDLHRRQVVVRALMEVRLGPPLRGRMVWNPSFLGASRWTGDPATWADHWENGDHL
jgi:site-specific DNA recombinase